MSLPHRDSSPERAVEIPILQVLSINVLEAATEEWLGGAAENARAGVLLSAYLRQIPPEQGLEVGSVVPMVGVDAELSNCDNSIWRAYYGAEFKRLYTMWNVTVVLGLYTRHKIASVAPMLAKLFAPSVIGAEHDHYMALRSFPLCLVMNNLVLNPQRPSADGVSPELPGAVKSLGAITLSEVWTMLEDEKVPRAYLDNELSAFERGPRRYLLRQLMGLLSW